MSLLTTERLLLREFTEADASFILELLNTPGWLQNIGDRGVRTEEDARAYILERMIGSYRRHGFGMYLVALKEEATPIGMCGLVRREGLEDVDIGFAFLPEHTGKGYALEAARAVMELATKRLRLKRLIAITLPENGSSTRLLEKLGMTCERNIRLPGDSDELMLYVKDLAG